MRRTVWGILLVLLILAVVMQAVTVVERRHIDESPATIVERGGRIVKVRANSSPVAAPVADAAETPRKTKSSSSRKRNPPPPDLDEIVWTKTVESSILPRAAAYEDALDRARNALTHEFNLSQPPSREFVNKQVKADYSEKAGPPDDSVLGETFSVTMDLQLTRETLPQLGEIERDFRVKDRMETLIRGSLILVAILACIAGYIRLDEYTKGYYTGRLRLAALALAAVATFSAANL